MMEAIDEKKIGEEKIDEEKIGEMIKDGKSKGSLVERLVQIKYVIGYQLPIHPTKYTVSITADQPKFNKKDVVETNTKNEFGNEEDKPTDKTKLKKKIEHPMITMESHFDLSQDDNCGIPLAFLSPLCKKTKKIVDRFQVVEVESVMILKKSTAFCGLVGCCCERNKEFELVTSVEPYIIMVYPKEVFVLSPNDNVPTEIVQKEIFAKVSENPQAPKKLDIKYFTI